MKRNTKPWAGLTVGAITLMVQASASTIGSENYTYDASGNIIQKAIDGKISRMSFDSSNRLVSTETAGEGREGITYDQSGRPVAYRNAAGEITRQLSYGYADKVTAVGDSKEASRSEFFYNAEGFLVGKSTAEGDHSTYAWDGISLAAQDDEVYVTEESTAGGSPLLCATSDQVIVSDHVGSTLAAGSRQYGLSTYGEGLEDARFTGKPYVQELGSFVFPHRLYSPASGSWTVADPSGFPDGTNAYAYVNGDPLSRVDPLGLAYRIAVASTPPPKLTDSATTGPALKVEGKTTNNVAPGDNPTTITVDYWTKGSGSGLFTSYSGEITGQGMVYCDSSSGVVSAYQYGGSWQRTGNAGSIATNVTCSQGTSNKELTASAKHAGTTAGSAGVTGAGFYGPGGAGAELSWTGGSSGIDCTTSCVYKSVEY